jgi:hypothetical protein
MCACVIGSIVLSMRLRSVASVVLVALGALVLLVGTVTFYVRQEIVDREAFADRALVALEDDGVRTVIRDEIVVGLVDDADGSIPWYMDGFSLVQDTPLGSQKVSQLSCTRNRGTADSPILMLNQWPISCPRDARRTSPSSAAG